MMTRLITLFLFSFSFWWIGCQNSRPAAEPAGGPIMAHAGVHSIEPATADARIELTVEGLAAGGTAKMIGISGDQNYIADTCIVADGGQMLFEKEKPYDAGLYYVILPDHSNVQMIIDANQHFTLQTNRSDLTGAMVVTGSKENELFYRNMAEQAPLDNALRTLVQKQRGETKGGPEYNATQVSIDSVIQLRRALLQSYADNFGDALFTKFKLCGQNPDLEYPTNPDGTIDIARQTWIYRSKLWDNVDFTDPRLLRTPVITNKLNKYIKELTAQRPDSIIAVTDALLGKVADNKEYFQFFANYVPLHYQPGESAVMDCEAIQVHMVQNYFTPDKAFWSDSAGLAALAKQAFEMEASLIGKKGPDVMAKDLNGDTKSIYEMKEPYIVVYMWNPECSHCKEETPQLVDFAKTHPDVGIFGIAVNTTDAEYRKYVKQMGMTWTNVFDPTNKAIYAKYYVDNTPEVYVLNPDRILIGKNLKINQIQTIIDRDKSKS